MLSVIFAMCLFALTMSLSPGPVNLISLSTGVNHGFKSAMPFVFGATIGFTVLLLLVGLGIGRFAAQNPLALEVLGYIGAAFIAYLGYKIARSTPDIKVSSKASLPTFHQGFFLTWLNPKAWIASLAGVSAFGLANSSLMLSIFVSLYFFICYACISSWALLGSKVTVLLAKPKNLQIFNRAMGGSLMIVALSLAIM